MGSKYKVGDIIVTKDTGIREYEIIEIREQEYIGWIYCLKVRGEPFLVRIVDNMSVVRENDIIGYGKEYGKKKFMESHNKQSLSYILPNIKASNMSNNKDKRLLEDILKEIEYTDKMGKTFLEIDVCKLGFKDFDIHDFEKAKECYKVKSIILDELTERGFLICFTRNSSFVQYIARVVKEYNTVLRISW